MSDNEQFRIPPYLDYGDGVFVRSLMIKSLSAGEVLLAMEDVAHSFQIKFSYHNHIITAVEAYWDRSPLSSCGGAAKALEKMVGCSLQDNLFNAGRLTDGTQQCTHMFDMFCLAVIHVSEGRADRRYDVIVPDEENGPVTATLMMNDQPVMALSLNNYEEIIHPQKFSGNSIFKGFMRWARDNVSPQEQEYCFILQKAMFVARVQTMDVEATIGEKATLSGPPTNACFASQEGRYDDAVRLDSLRRFKKKTIQLDQVLRFVEST